MARINGVQIKALKRFKGHDGEPLTQGNIYMDNKKIGEYSEDSWGGMMRLHIEKEKRGEFGERVKEYRAIREGTRYPEEFIDELIDLTIKEQEFKKAKKKGCNMVIVRHPRLWDLVLTTNHTERRKIEEWLDSDKQGCRYKENGRYNLEVYTNLEQFIIRV